MRRRSFVAALPLAAAGTLSGFRAEAQGQQGAGSPNADAETAPPKFQPADAERFERPDVHAGAGLPELALQAGRRRWAVRARRERRIRWPR